MFLLSYLRPLLRGAPESQRFSPALPPKNSIVLCLTSTWMILSEFLHQVWNWGQDSHFGLRMTSTIGWKDHWSLIESLLNLCHNKLTVLVCECTGTIFGFSVLFHGSVSLSFRNITQFLLRWLLNKPWKWVEWFLPKTLFFFFSKLFSYQSSFAFPDKFF